MIYKTSLGKSAKSITIGITLLFACIIIWQCFILKETANSISLYVTVVLVLIYFIPLVLRPVDYSVTEDKLIIHRPFMDVKIDRSHIKKVTLLGQDSMGFSIRTFGVGGLFGHYGKFWSKKLGSMTWYATRKDRMVMVQTTEDKKIILTPDDPEQFVANFNS